uniref:G2/M phase-specific E3 ubiquitin-protein ligase n=1 Tax=Aquila chrysaetos chrysaetos TaxID=223781 RepID=A0A663ERA1_AQUCH
PQSGRPGDAVAEVLAPLSHFSKADPALCGDKLEKRGLCAHVFCLVSYAGLFQRGDREAGLMGFLPEDIRRTIARAAQKHCFVCGESGAAISCWEMGCDRSFHLPCAVEGGCVTQFALRAYCWQHRPEQAGEAAPEENTTCLICLDLVEERKSYGTMVCPACKHAWFHRGCIQVGGQALCAGISCFQCPLCRDKELFLSEMLTMGIRIPFRLVSFGPAPKTGGCKRCAAPGAAPAVLPGPPLSRESGLQLHGGAGNRAGGGEQGRPASPLCRGSRGSSIFLSPSDCHRGRTGVHTQH